MYYRDSSIDNVVWLNPTKTVKYIHDSILSKEIFTVKKGKVPKIEFDNLLIKNVSQKSQSKEQFDKVKELLLNEKVIFFDTSQDTYIIPGYLPLSIEDDLHNNLSNDFRRLSPSFILKFQHFIPFGLINELICLYGNLPKIKEYWRNEIIFWFDESHRVWIKLNFSQLTIAVYIKEFDDDSQLKMSKIRKIVFHNIIDLYQGNPLCEYHTNSFLEQTKSYLQEKEHKEIIYPRQMYLSVQDDFYIDLASLENHHKNEITSYKLDELGKLNINQSKIHSIALYKDFNNNINQIEMQESMPKVLISYSWDDEPHKEWVLRLARKLTENGVHIFLDRFDLIAGKDMTHFMENSINLSDRVLLIMTPNYKIKAENRKGGVGYECSMITAEIFNNQLTDKFIPIRKNGERNECTPIFVKSKIDIDMGDSAKLDESFEELLRVIYNEPKVKRPQIGKKPSFS